MNKKKFVFLAIMMVLVIAFSSMLFIACDKKNNETPSEDSTPEQETIEPTEGLIISNGDFKVVGTDKEDYPRSINDWSGAKSYTSGDYPSGVTAGAISLDDALYTANAANWNDADKTLYALLTANGRYDADEIKHALMIYMPKTTPAEEEGGEDDSATHGPTAYGYTSASFKIEAHKVYKLSVDVLTYDIAGQTAEQNPNNVPGARIYVSSNTMAEFEAINTNGEWKTYTIYIDGSASSDTTLTLMLALGKYSSTYRDGLTTGYAFFDNLTLEPTTQAEYAQAVTDELANNAYLQTTTLKVPNGRFEYGTTTLSSTSTPNSWSFVTGNRSEEDPAPTSLGYNAVIDASKIADNYNLYSSTYYLKPNADSSTQPYVPANSLSALAGKLNVLPNRIGTNVYMLSQQLMTASGIKSSRAITIEKNKVYALSIDVYTYGVHGAGASLVLSGADGKDIVIKGISAAAYDGVLIGSTPINPDDNSYIAGSDVVGATTDGWKTFTFYILGNEYKDYNYNMTIWLGTDGTNSNTAVSYKNYSSTSSSSSATTYKANGTFANGWLFVDELKLTEISESAIPAASEGIEYAGADQTLDCSIAGKEGFKGIKVDLSTGSLFDGTGNGLEAAGGTYVEGTAKTSIGIPEGWSTDYDLEDSSNPVITGGIITSGLVDIASESAYDGQGTYPGQPYDIKVKKAYMMHASKDSYYEVETDKFLVSANGFYRLSFWVKTVDVKDTSGIYVYLLDKDGETISSFTKINTKDFSEYTSDWCELTFLIRGSNELDEEMHLKFTLGTGDRWADSTLTSGAAFVANVCYTSISYSTFKSTTTGTYVKSIDRTSSSTYTFTNASFDEYNLDDELLDPTKALEEQTVLAQPTSWTISDSTLKANTADSKLVAGVLALHNVDKNLYFEHSTQTNNVFPSALFASELFDNFYGDKTAADYLSSANLDTINGPNVLALASTTNTDKYAVGYASSKFSLSSNGIYAISVYVKGANAEKASVYLSGEASTSVESGMFKIETPANEWTKYTFYVNVGSTNVSINLNLWLGYNANLVGGDADAAKSNGAVFFDGVIKKSVSQADFDAVVEDAHNKKISFMTDSFDSLTSTVESRASLSSPNGWSGATGKDQVSSNTKSGVIYADSNYFAVNTIDGIDYVGILGKAYTLDDVTLSADETEGKTEEEIVALKEARLKELKVNNWLSVAALGDAKSGKNMLVINNMDKSAYTYTGTSLTLSAESYYKISVWARTAGLNTDADAGAYIEFYLGSHDEEGNPLSFKAQSKDDWTEYTFYVKTLKKSVTSASLKLSLGNVITTGEGDEAVTTGLTSGYAFFDDVTVEKITAADYEAAVASDTVLLREVKEEDEGKSDDDNTDTNTNENKFNLEYLWWMIPTIIIGALIIIVVIVYIVKKVAKKAGKKSASASSKEAIAKKHSRYDDNRE